MFLKNGNPQNPYCNGIEGVMEAYYQSLKSVQLFGPTNFSPVINHVARYIQNMSFYLWIVALLWWKSPLLLAATSYL